jgi:hypothetical protein
VVDGGERLQGSDDDFWCLCGEEGNELFDDGIGYVEFDVEKESLDGGGFCGRTTGHTFFDDGLDCRCAGAGEVRVSLIGEAE